MNKKTIPYSKGENGNPLYDGSLLIEKGGGGHRGGHRGAHGADTLGGGARAWALAWGAGYDPDYDYDEYDEEKRQTSCTLF